MNGEIKNNETREIKPSMPDNYKNIKPEKGMSLKDTNEYWDGEFKNVSDNNESIKADAVKEYFDDNGVKYREGDKLLPNKEYQINEYDYKTDEKGRVISAEGKLRIRDPEYKRNMENVRDKSGQDYKSTDDQSHLVGHQFGGSDRLENLVPMDKGLNQGDYAKLENTLAKAVKDGADVRLKVEPIYEKDSTRPSEFKVSYSIDGDRETTTFKNESGAKV